MGRALGGVGIAVGVALAAAVAPACGGGATASDLFGSGVDGSVASEGDGGAAGDACPAAAHCTSPGDGGVSQDGGGTCRPACVAGTCGGSDGCGGTCACPNGATCKAGVCSAPPTADAGLSCDAPADCMHAADLGQVSGDTTGPGVNATGSTSKWLAVRVTEDDQGILGVPLNVTANLTSPPGANFDLFLYMDPAGTPSTRMCTGAPVASSTKASGVDTATHSWGESVTANNGDDTRIVSIEVRHVSGACAPGATWSLTVTGH